MTASSNLTIIGAGQLGLYLCQAARQLGIATQVISSDPTAPVVAIADSSIVSEYDAAGLAQQIADYADVVTFEFEAVPEALLAELEKLEKYSSPKLPVPNPDS